MRRPTALLMSPRAMDRRFAATPRDIDYVLDRRGALAELLGSLPRAQREAVRLFFIEDRPADEVVELVGASAPELTTMLSEACHALRAEAQRRFPALCADGNGACR